MQTRVGVSDGPTEAESGLVIERRFTSVEPSDTPTLVCILLYLLSLWVRIGPASRKGFTFPNGGCLMIEEGEPIAGLKISKSGVNPPARKAVDYQTRMSRSQSRVAPDPVIIAPTEQYFS